MANDKMEGFRGDLSWVHAREGHAGKAYWPGGVSGVTLDPGVDLGHVRPELFETAYKELLTSANSRRQRKSMESKEKMPRLLWQTIRLLKAYELPANRQTPSLNMQRNLIGMPLSNVFPLWRSRTPCRLCRQ